VRVKHNNIAKFKKKLSIASKRTVITVQIIENYHHKLFHRKWIIGIKRQLVPITGLVAYLVKIW